MLGLGFETAGVALGEHGEVIVDDHNRAADGVWAVGDVTGIMPFTHVANYHGRIVADAILGKPRVARHKGIPRVVFGDPEIAAVGLTKEQADSQGLRTASVEIDLSESIARPWTYEKEPRGKMGLLADTDAGVLVGAWAIAPLASEWIHQAALAIREHISIDVLLDQVAQFPTYNEAYLASLLNVGVPIKTAAIDFDGEFDVHSAAGVRTGAMTNNFNDLSATIAAFKADIGPLWRRVTIVTLTEFGRRLEENASGGVDHGWASAIFVMGGGVKGGQVVSKWPGLGEKDLSDGDLAVTTDYRHVLAEVLRNRGGLSTEAISAVLPSFTPQALGITRVISGVTEQPRPTPGVTPPKGISPVHKKKVPVRKKKPRKKSAKKLTV